MSRLAPAFAVLASVSHAASAQCIPGPTTFCITQIAPQQFAVNGVGRMPLTLTRGQSYTFQMVLVPVLHPFALGETPESPGPLLTAGVVGPNPATGNAAIIFTPGPTTPDTVYYHCTFHPGMGAAITIVDPDPCCVDYNHDEELDFTDVEGFLAAYVAQIPGDCAPGADLNDDGEFDFSDIERFLALYTAGC